MIRTPENLAEWDEYFALRYKVLRAPWNQPVGSERDAGDTNAIHLAYFLNHEIIGVGRLDLIENQGAQVRYMAIQPAHQGRGVGKKIMLALEQVAHDKGCKKMILHARENALPFYYAVGYEKIEKSYVLFSEIQHYLMFKNLS